MKSMIMWMLIGSLSKPIAQLCQNLDDVLLLPSKNVDPEKDHNSKKLYEVTTSRRKVIFVITTTEILKRKVDLFPVFYIPKYKMLNQLISPDVVLSCTCESFMKYFPIPHKRFELSLNLL